MRKLTKLVLMTLGIMLGTTACADQQKDPRFEAGVHYRVLEQPIPEAKPEKIEVREFFFYGCPHCYHAEHYVQQWLKQKPEYVNFVRTPVLFMRGAEPLARAFYVAKNLGILHKVHTAIFHAIHERRMPLFSAEALAEFFSQYGVKPEKFNQLYTSFGVSTKVRQAKALTRRYRVRGVPFFTVAGKYVVLRGNLKGDHQTMQVIKFLVEKVRKSEN